MNWYYFEKYYNQKSLIHSLNPKIKLLSSLFGIFSFLLLGPTPFWILQLSLFISLILITLLAKIPLTVLAKRIVILMPIILLVITLNLIISSGTIQSLILLFSRSILSLFILNLLILTTPFSDILKVLASWSFPKILLIILSFIYRYFFVLSDEANKMLRSITLRIPTKSKLLKIKLISKIIGILFIRSYDRAEKVYYAMLLQGFDGEWRENM